METPVAILPLPTYDGETEKLIRIKDKEVRSVFFSYQQTFNTDCNVDLLFFYYVLAQSVKKDSMGTKTFVKNRMEEYFV